MQRTKRPLSFLLAVLMIVSMFAAVPFTASAMERSEFLDFGPLLYGDAIGKRFIAKPANMIGGNSGWTFTGANSSITISAKNGETITKVVLRTSSYCSSPTATANGKTISVSKTERPDSVHWNLIFEDINASEVVIRDDPNASNHIGFGETTIYYIDAIEHNVLFDLSSDSECRRTETEDSEDEDGETYTEEFYYAKECTKGLVTVSPVSESDDMDADGGWWMYPSENQGANIRVPDGYVITKIVATVDSDYTAVLTVDGKNVSGTHSEKVTTFENLNTTTAFLTVGDDGDCIQSIDVYYADPDYVSANPDQEAADEVIALIDAISKVEYTDASKEKIDAARAAYDALTDAQKALVSNYTMLTDAETAYAALAPATYTVTWRNYNGDVLETDTVTEGDTPTYDGAAPVMGADPLYTYNWSGWSTDVVPAAGDATYIAAFDAIPNTEPASESLVGLKLCLNWSYDFGGAYIRYYNTSSASFGVTELTAIQGYNNSCQLYLRGADGGTYVAVLSPLEGLTPTGMEITGGTGTQQDPYTLSLLYSTPYVAATGISVAPDWSSTFVIDRVIPVSAALNPKWATVNVAWSVAGDSIALYADKACTTPVGNATNLATVYAKGISAGDAVITATYAADASVTASCNVSVQESDPVIGLKCFKGWTLDGPDGAYYSADRRPEADRNWPEQLSGSALTEIETAYGTDWHLMFRTDNNFWGYYLDITEQTPTGIEIVSGSGVHDDPYMMELIYEEPPFVPVNSVSLPSSAKVFEGESVAVTASINPKYANNQQVVWSVANDNVALYTDAECTTPVGSEATDALTVYAQGVNIGTAAVTVASDDNAALTATCNVKVCDLSEKIEVNYELTDDYGDGWYGGSKLIIREKGTDVPTATLTMDDGSSLSGSVALFKGCNYELVWMKGQYDAECGYTITNPFTGEEISASDCSGYTNGQVIATWIDPAVEAAKATAKDELDTYKNADDYADAQKTELADAIAAGKAAIDAAESLDAVEEALTAAKAAIDAIKATDATPNDQQFVTIDDQISITLALDLGARGKTTDDVAITVAGAAYDAAPVSAGEGVYKYKIEMAAAQIADEIVVSFDENPDNNLTTSVKDYCNTLCTDAAYQAENYADARALAKAIQEYGKAANAVFGNTSLEGIGDPDKTAVNAYTGAKFADGTGNKVSGASFMALTKPEFRFYTNGITEQQGYDYNQAGVTAAMEGGSDKLTARFVKKADGSILIEVTGVTAENMDKPITVTVTGLGTITFNGNAFAKAMAKSGDTKQQNLGAALYNYGVAANACFARH